MRIFITGGSRGIGLAMANHFIGKGYKVAICSRHGSLDGALSLNGDVGDYGDCKRMFDQIEAKFGGLDVLVNNAGISHVGFFADTTPDTWQSLINTNLLGVINCSHIAVQHMLSKGGGHIINISSIWGGAGASCEAVYSATKGGVDAFTKALAKEVGGACIKVNAIACGVVETEMNNFLDPEERVDLLSQIPLGRFAKPEEIALMADFLIQSGYINGQILNLDGGYI
ncbi:MAG: SDR family NAD(P)-dependent oxidoreductase [Defluviitaleaceae bacterium]|nr:SDR family NAD(P)-dependent oxidoreductase [Defluviitaleaceae bacterium]